MSEKQMPLFPPSARMNDLAIKLALSRIKHGVATTDSSASVAVLVENCVNEMATEIHLRNVEAGWWSDLTTGEHIERNMGELLMLAVSEICEIPDGSQFYIMKDDKLPDRLMAEVELADFCIRLFDTAGAYIPEALGSYFISAMPWKPKNFRLVDEYKMAIVRSIGGAMEAHRKGRHSFFRHFLGQAMFQSWHTAQVFQFDLADAIFEKMQFNASREDHKPENRAKDGGKKY